MDGIGDHTGWLKRGVLVMLWGMGCAHTVSRYDLKKPEGLYAQAVDDLDGKLYDEALARFEKIKTQFLASPYAVLADLRRADVSFQRHRYPEAIDAYQNFITFHPQHEQAPYAMLQIGEAYFAQIPQEGWFFPPSAEKDQTFVHQAMQAYHNLLMRFGQSKQAPQARKRAMACQRMLADHEMYVGLFYFKRTYYKAAAQRAETVLQTYPNAGLGAEALWLAGQAHWKVGDTATAQRYFKKLMQTYPQTPEAYQAKGMH